ncbi:unnamed protein product, partial [Ectocarpus sp. 12 AP-2014]
IIERLRTVRYAREKATPEEFSRRGVTQLRKQVQQTRGQAFEAGYSPAPRLFGSARSKYRGQSRRSSNGGGRNVGPHRNRQTTKRKCFSSSSRSNRGKRTLHGHVRDARGGMLLRSGSERRARMGTKHEQQVASESSMVSSGDIEREEKTSCHCPPPLKDSNNGQDGDRLPICVSVHTATRGAEAKKSGGSQEQHGKMAAAAAVKSEGGGVGDGDGDGDDNGGGGSQSDSSEFAGGEGDQEEQYSEFDEKQEERREEKEGQEQDEYSEFGDGSSTREAIVQPAEAERHSSEVEDVRQEQRLGDGLENEGEKQDTREGSAGEATAGLDKSDYSRGQTEDP